MFDGQSLLSIIPYPILSSIHKSILTYDSTTSTHIPLDHLTNYPDESTRIYNIVIISAE